MAFSGMDHELRKKVQRRVEGNDVAASFAQTTVFGGYLLPVIVAPGLYLTGLLATDSEAARAGAAAVQSVVMTTISTFVLKAMSGRPFPLHGGDPIASDRLQHPEYATQFRPISVREVAWPSGHTSVSFALAASLTEALPGRWWVPAVSYPVAVAIGAGMLIGDHHWPSDVVAGALLGQVIGRAVGRGFSATPDKQKTFAITPMIQPNFQGIRAAGVF